MFSLSKMLETMKTATLGSKMMKKCFLILKRIPVAFFAKLLKSNNKKNVDGYKGYVFSMKTATQSAYPSSLPPYRGKKKDTADTSPLLLC